MSEATLELEPTALRTTHCYVSGNKRLCTGITLTPCLPILVIVIPKRLG